MDVRYRWERCRDTCAAIPSAAGARYTPSADDAGFTIRLVLAAPGLAERALARRRRPSAARPALAARPSIAGRPRVGARLVARRRLVGGDESPLHDRLGAVPPRLLARRHGSDVPRASRATAGSASGSRSPPRTTWAPRRRSAGRPRASARPSRGTCAASTSIRAIAARGSASSAASSCSREIARQRTAPTAWMSAMRPPPGSSTSISPISSPGPSVEASAGTLDLNGALEHEQQLGAGLADPHDRLPVRVLPLLAEREDRIEQLPRQQREDARVADEPLVAAAVEEQRLALAVPRELDLPEEERVVAAPVRAHDARDEVRERAVDERRVVHELEQSAPRVSSTTRPAKWSESPACRASSTFTPNRVPSCSRFAHPRAAIDGDEHERRPQRDGHERVRRHPVHLLAVRVVSTVTPVANIPSVRRNAIAGSPSRPSRARARSAAGACVERGAERLGRRDRARRSRPRTPPVRSSPPSRRILPRSGARRSGPTLRRISAPAPATSPAASSAASSGVRHRRRLLAPVRPLAVLDDAAEEEQQDADHEHATRR